MVLKPGYIVTLNIVRKADFGYFLSNGSTDILLHERETKEELEVGQDVEVFLYHDHEGRLAATMERPILKMDEIAWLEAVHIRQGHGVFFYNGISRDLFVSIDELPFDRNLWPQRGDKLPLEYTWDKKGRLMGKIVYGKRIEDEAMRASSIMMHKELIGHAYQYLDEGVRIFTDDRYIGFLHNDEMTREPRYGERVRVRVIYVREDGKLNVTMKPLRSIQQQEDSERIYAYLQSRNGAMPYSDKSQPDDIEARFGISKGAFKRALGKLLKENKIEQREGWTYIKEK